MQLSRQHVLYGQSIFILLMLLTSFFFEYVVRLTPCALCLIQRVFIVIMLIASLWSLLRYRVGRFSIGAQWCIALFSVLGMLVSWRHIWLQQHAADLAQTSCLPDISLMLRMMSLPDVLLQLLRQGGTECSEIKWLFLGVSMPSWVLLLYIITFSSVLYLLCSKRNID